MTLIKWGDSIIRSDQVRRVYISGLLPFCGFSVNVEFLNGDVITVDHGRKIEEARVVLGAFVLQLEKL